MRFVKCVSKPIVVALTLVAVALLASAKVIVIKLKLQPMYKYVAKLDIAKKRLCRLIFNPYRISAGFRPAWMTAINDPESDINKCHEIISKARLAKSAS